MHHCFPSLLLSFSSLGFRKFHVLLMLIFCSFPCLIWVLGMWGFLIFAFSFVIVWKFISSKLILARICAYFGVCPCENGCWVVVFFGFSVFGVWFTWGDLVCWWPFSSLYFFFGDLSSFSVEHLLDKKELRLWTGSSSSLLLLIRWKN